ncbi:hypothetical protein MKW98_012049 [Papaver atlanticum]|uniref:Uncharacterized protein n=1 Tax=Papaver atlanticum TaxID=357466 RepID=A0AAD4XFJ8_9MAGN|nr:hypothetical protein MKW98_012049 [Papaver atlanticum]
MDNSNPQQTPNPDWNLELKFPNSNLPPIKISVKPIAWDISTHEWDSNSLKHNFVDHLRTCSFMMFGEAATPCSFFTSMLATVNLC